MTVRVLPFAASPHVTADALLPFYVNATLHGDELAFVEEHVRSCEECQHEVAWLRKIFADLASDPAFLDARHRVQNAPEALETRPSRRIWPARLRAGLRATPQWTRWLLAAQLAAIAILGTSMLTDTRDVASYRTLGAPNRSAQLQDAVAVMFDPGITESAMRQILVRVGARIVDGPTVNDVFVIEIPAERVEQALQALHAEREVRVAERLGPGPNR